MMTGRLIFRFWLPTKTAIALSIWTAPPRHSTPCRSNAVVDYYTKENANPHRGVYELAMRATDAHEGARHTVAQFFNAEDDEIRVHPEHDRRA